MTNFDPNGPGLKGSIFGLPQDYDSSNIVIIPVPWDATVSYREGTSRAPQSILDASTQVDLYCPDTLDGYEKGIFMDPIPNNINNLNRVARQEAIKVIDALDRGELPDSKSIKLVNQYSTQLNDYLFDEASRVISDGKKPFVLGGDHSTPFGLMRALSEKYDEFAILQIDAHADLRESYEGFSYSHASIMFNALNLPSLTRLVQVGIRDLCDEEALRISDDDRVITHFDYSMKEYLMNGGIWGDYVDTIITDLPDLIYLSFDIDGLQPSLCPNTGTPVPGGLSYEMIQLLFRKLSVSGKKIIGADLTEVAPGESTDWDSNVGARVLYMMISYLL